MYMNELQQLCLAGTSVVEPMLGIRQGIMEVEVVQEVICYYVLHKLGNYAGEQYWSIVNCLVLFPFFEER